MKRTLFLSAAILAAASLALGLTGAAVASPPSNDDLANATVIDPSASSYDQTVDNSQATMESGEPAYCGLQQSVWYSLTPTKNETVQVGLSGSTFYDQVIVGYRSDGPGLGGLTQLGCNTFGAGLPLHLEANTTYYFAGGSYFGSGGFLHFGLQVVPPPPNDDFANASVVDPSSLPYSDSQSGLAASRESGEPVASCNVFGPVSNSWWYVFTADETRSYTVSYNGGVATAAVYTGSTLQALSEKACRSGGGSNALSFAAVMGTTYYVQIGDYYAGAFGGVSFSLRAAPDPVPWFAWNPGDPSAFDTLQFYDGSSDPGGNGFSSEVWNFGDGTSQTNPGQFPTHKFASDGDYKVKLTITTTDGRVASLEQVVHVRTHDVAIAKLGVPQSASVGQTRSISVGISNKRYAENVQVQLFKSGPNGFELVGTLQQSVPVRNGGRTTDFNFSYTFTSADKSLGKVTFKAVASLIGARDALPADNEAVALPTKVG